MSQAYVNIVNGSYRNQPISNVVFPLVKPFQAGAKGNFITVDGSHLFGAGKEKIRVTVPTLTDYYPSDVDAYIAQGATAPAESTTIESHAVEVVSNETDEEIMLRIEKRFSILHAMTKAACEGSIRAMIVTGPPGVGKSFGVEAELERAALFDRVSGRRVRSEVVKGGISDIGLYQKLYEFSDKDNVLVFDDADDLFYETTTLNLLKAALDTSKVRRIAWNKESRTLNKDGIPNQFNFNGSIIFITNIKFDNIRSKVLKDHLIALESRCHYLDLRLDTTREKLLRIRQIANTGELFGDYEFSKTQEEEVIEYLFANQPKLRETSLRTALKVADLYKSFPTIWKDYASELVMKSLTV